MSKGQRQRRQNTRLSRYLWVKMHLYLLSYNRIIMNLIWSGELTEAATWQVSRREKHHTGCCHNNILQWTQSTIWSEIFKTQWEDKPIDNYFWGIRIPLNEQLQYKLCAENTGVKNNALSPEKGSASEPTQWQICKTKQNIWQIDSGELSKGTERKCLSRGKVWFFFNFPFHKIYNGNENDQRGDQGKKFFEPNVLIHSCYQLTHTLIAHIHLYSIQVQTDLERFTWGMRSASIKTTWCKTISQHQCEVSITTILFPVYMATASTSCF